VRPFACMWADTGQWSPAAGRSSSGSANGGGVRQDCVSGHFINVHMDALGAILLSLFRSTCLRPLSLACCWQWDL